MAGGAGNHANLQMRRSRLEENNILPGSDISRQAADVQEDGQLERASWTWVGVDGGWR